MRDEKNSTLDTFLHYAAEAQHFLHTYDPYAPEPLRPVTDKIGVFLRRHAGMSYSTFGRQANPLELSTDDYAIIHKRLRRMLFNYRARVYLSALADCEAQGYNLDELLELVAVNEVPHIKRMKTNDEPTFQKIYAILHSSKNT